MTELEQQAIDAANNAPLFNIPAGLWQDYWRQLQDKRRCLRAVYFWIGVYQSAPYNDSELKDRSLLARVAITIGCNTCDG